MTVKNLTLRAKAYIGREFVYQQLIKKRTQGVSICVDRPCVFPYIKGLFVRLYKIPYFMFGASKP